MSIVVVGTVGYDTVETPAGRVEDVLGGSASYFSLAARFFSPVSIVTAVGSDFREEDRQLFVEHGIDVRALKQLEGKTFRWAGRYSRDMNSRTTTRLELNVFADFQPELLADQQRADYVFLANISPELQLRVLESVANPKLVAADTMNHWIENDREKLVQLLRRIDILLVNDDEARMLSGEHSLVKAGPALLAMGPKTVVIKRGEHGVMLFNEGGLFVASAFPVDTVVDPTGAGDSFAGAFMGYLARMGRISEATRRTAAIYGTVVASFVVEEFSVARLRGLSFEEIDNRFRAYLTITDCHQNRWTSPS